MRAPFVRLALSCEPTPVRIGPDLVVERRPREQAEDALHALAHGVHAPCVVLQRVLELLGDWALDGPVWRAQQVSIGRPWPPVVADVSDTASLEAELARRAAVLCDPRARLAIVFAELLPVVDQLPESLHRFVLGRSALALAPEDWGLDERRMRRNDLVNVISTALGPIAQQPVHVDPWAVAGFDGQTVTVPHTWVGTVWAWSAEEIDGHATLSLREQADGTHVARLLSPAGRTSSALVEVRDGRWRLCSDRV